MGLRPAGGSQVCIFQHKMLLCSSFRVRGLEFMVLVWDFWGSGFRV